VTEAAALPFSREEYARRLDHPSVANLDNIQEAYLRFLLALGAAPTNLLRARRGPTGPLFELRQRE
jgi:hypothetical protein